MSESLKMYDIVKIIDDDCLGRIMSCDIDRNGVTKYHVMGYEAHGYYEERELQKIEEGAK